VEVRSVCGLDVAKVVDGEVKTDIPGRLSLLLRRNLALTSGLFLKFVKQAVNVRNTSDLLLFRTIRDDFLHICDPLMGEDILQRYSFLRVELKDASDEVFERVRKGVA
jgi:hypothetical protein